MKEGDSREGSPSADPGTPILVRIEEAHRVVMEAEEGEVLASSLEVTSPRMNYNASKNRAAAMMGEKLLEAAQVQLVAKTVAAITNRKSKMALCKWREFTEENLKFKEQLSKAASFWVNPVLADATQCLKIWQQVAARLVAEERVLRRAAARFKGDLVALQAQCVEKWREVCDENNRLMAFLKKCAIRMKSDEARKAGDAMMHWRQIAKDERIAAELLAREREAEAQAQAAADTRVAARKAAEAKKKAKAAEQAAAVAAMNESHAALLKKKKSAGAGNQGDANLQSPMVRGAWSSGWSSRPKNPKVFGIYCVPSDTSTF